jgi:hypothetical protein
MAGEIRLNAERDQIGMLRDIIAGGGGDFPWLRSLTPAPSTSSHFDSGAPTKVPHSKTRCARGKPSQHSLGILITREGQRSTQLNRPCSARAMAGLGQGPSSLPLRETMVGNGSRTIRGTGHEVSDYTPRFFEAPAQR